MQEPGVSGNARINRLAVALEVINCNLQLVPGCLSFWGNDAATLEPRISPLGDPPGAHP
jgi:hypothetical protein